MTKLDLYHAGKDLPCIDLCFTVNNMVCKYTSNCQILIESPNVVAVLFDSVTLRLGVTPFFRIVAILLELHRP